MPSTPTLWNASETLSLTPLTPSFTCIGFAPSKGRRCHNPIAGYNCQDAAKLVQRIGRLDRRSSRLAEMLEELAPKVLCKRWHQRQADGIVEEWKMAIRRARREDEAADEAREAAREARAEREAERETAREAAREARVARAAREAAREARVAAREAAEETREDREETETATLRRALEEATSSLRVLSSAIEASRGTLAGDGVDFADLQRTLGRLGVQPAVPAAQSGSGSPEQSTASSSEPGTSSVAESQAQSPETESEQQDASPSSTAVEPASPATETQTPDTPSANTTLIDSTSSTPFSPSPTTTLNEEIDFAFGRRTVTGECGICLLALRNGEALTWCQSQCGQNFHAGCIQRWVETDEYTQTCPNCRAMWGGDVNGEEEGREMRLNFA